MSTLPDTLNIDQLADLLLCDAETAADQLRRGVLPGLKFGRGWVVPTAALLATLNQLAAEQAAERRGDQAPAPAAPPSAPAAQPKAPPPSPYLTLATLGETPQRGRKRLAPPPLPSLASVGLAPHS